MKVAALIPHYNHADKVGQVVAAMRAQGLEVLIVDDGSREADRAVLQRLAEQDAAVQLHVCPDNGGKGRAMKTGFRWAERLGYTHVLQVDADAQHHLEDAARLLALAHQRPDVLVCGDPCYGDDAPRARLYGRRLTNFWASVHTGRQIHDAMCGFRIYPLAPVIRVLERYRIGDRMEFDIAILVALAWEGTAFAWIRTPVVYAPDGVSHFMPFQDNLRISLMHARMFFGRLGQLARACWRGGQR